MDRKAFRKRTKRVSKRIHGTRSKPRLTVYRSSRQISAQLINDEKGITLVSFSSSSLKKQKSIKGTDIAFLVGEELGKRAKKKKMTKVVFDRRGYKYHGRVKALADGARKGGLKF